MLAHFTPQTLPAAPAVLLFRGTGLLSWLIRWQTRGTYSHAALLMTDGRIVESWPGIGVRVRHVSNWRGIDAFSVPRLSAAEWDRAIAFALNEVGCGYDWCGVIRFISRRHLPYHPNDWFCSELVFEALKHGGLELLKRIPADEVSPQMLSLSPLLKAAGHRSTVNSQREASAWSPLLPPQRHRVDRSGNRTAAALLGGMASRLSVLLGRGRGPRAAMPSISAALAACVMLMLSSCAHEAIPVTVGVCKDNVCVNVGVTIPARAERQSTRVRASGKEAVDVQ